MKSTLLACSVLGLGLLFTQKLVFPILGIMVALIKIAELATVDVGIGMYAVGAMVVLFTAIATTFDPREVWRRVEWADGRVPPGAEAAR